MIEGYYYLHTDGNLIYKRDMPGITEDFEESDFVKAYWPIDPTNRLFAWNLLVGALAKGADKYKIRELATKWRCDNVDAKIYAHYAGYDLGYDTEWSATKDDIIGRGKTCLEAMADCLKKIP